MRDTTVVKIASEASRLLTGLILMAGGGAVIWYQLVHPPHSDKIILAAGGVCLFGALIMPSILPVFKDIVATVAPYLPFVKKAQP